MALVPWTYNNPRVDWSKSETRQFLFHGHIVEVFQDTSAEIDATKNTALKLWDGAFLLARYIETSSSFPAGFWSGKRCIELGSGCGLVGTVAWLLGSDVTLTDLSDAVPHTERCVRSNVGRLSESEATLASRVTDIRILPYRWGDDDDATRLKCPYDYIFGSDIVYQPECARFLITALDRLSDSKTTILLSYKRRGLGEDCFFPMLEGAGFEIVNVSDGLNTADFVNSGYNLFHIIRN